MQDKQEKKDQERFNSITQKVKPENQNQHHNVRKEAVDPKRRQVQGTVGEIDSSRGCRNSEIGPTKVLGSRQYAAAKGLFYVLCIKVTY